MINKSGTISVWLNMKKVSISREKFCCLPNGDILGVKIRLVTLGGVMHKYCY